MPSDALLLPEEEAEKAQATHGGHRPSAPRRRYANGATSKGEYCIGRLVGQPEKFFPLIMFDHHAGN